MWSSVQCAVQGRSHVISNTPCQDKTFHMSEDDTEVIALADGAGSAKLSHFGAELVTKRICELLVKQFRIYYGETDGATIKRVIVAYLIDELEKLAKEHNCEVNDLASTILAVAVHKDRFIIIHIGDGVIGYVKNGELKIASHPDNGEFVNTTIFVTSKNALSSMKLIKGQLNGITGFVLMSDGTEASLYSKRNKCLAPVLKKLMNLSQSMESFYLQNEIKNSFEQVVAKATTDDCSLIFLVEEDYTFPGYNKLTIEQKCALFHLQECRDYKRRLKKFDAIVKYACLPRTVSQISKSIYVKKKYCYKHIDYLIQRNLLVSNNGLIHTAVIMDK